MVKNKPTKLKNIEDLQKASEALYYEIKMLNNCASAISECSKNPILYSQFTVNILIESFCVHLRNLIEFFRNKTKDRITYDYFLTKNIKVKFSHDLKERYSEKVNNLLSHLTFHRLKYTIDEKDWDLNQIASEVNQNIIQFYNLTDKHFLCPKIIEYISSLQSGDTTKHHRYTHTTSDAILQTGTITRFSKE